ncbi:phage holin family protein [Pasteurella multocida]|uniref:phage holin family protein n=1 Tax=Pasteurella multocida TaxID=747 RepID=UPI00287750F7|nr:phage holin family protein [Pasteurella multocida]WND42538.1 phage holin family protein [Pasteurella multocida]
MQILQKIKNITLTSLELIHVRLDMARIELVEQKNFLITLLSALFVIFILLLVSFISLLFGLNSLLDPEIKQIVFFAISAGAFFLILILLQLMRKILKKQRNFMVDTLTEVKHDIQAIKGALVSPSSKDQE